MKPKPLQGDPWDTPSYGGKGSYGYGDSYLPPASSSLHRDHFGWWSDPVLTQAMAMARAMAMVMATVMATA